MAKSFPINEGKSEKNPDKKKTGPGLWFLYLTYLKFIMEDYWWDDEFKNIGLSLHRVQATTKLLSIMPTHEYLYSQGYAKKLLKSGPL